MPFPFCFSKLVRSALSFLYQLTLTLVLRFLPALNWVFHSLVTPGTADLIGVGHHGTVVGAAQAGYWVWVWVWVHSTSVSRFDRIFKANEQDCPKKSEPNVLRCGNRQGPGVAKEFNQPDKFQSRWGKKGHKIPVSEARSPYEIEAESRHITIRIPLKFCQWMKSVWNFYLTCEEAHRWSLVNNRPRRRGHCGLWLPLPTHVCTHVDTWQKTNVLTIYCRYLQYAFVGARSFGFAFSLVKLIFLFSDNIIGGGTEIP